MMYRLARSLLPALAIFCLALLRVTVFATRDVKTFELGSNVTLTCGNISNLSSSTELSWTKGDIVLLNTTFLNESSLVLTDLEEEAIGLYICKANLSQILRSVQLSLATNSEDEDGEEEMEDGGLTKTDYTAIALGLGLTVFIVVSMAFFLCRAEKRRKKEMCMRRWKKARVGNVNMAVEEESVKKPIPKNDFHLKNGAGSGAGNMQPRAGRSDVTPAEYRWLETLGRDPYYEVDRDSDVDSIGGTMWKSTAYV